MTRMQAIKQRLMRAKPWPWEWWTSCSWRRLGVKDDYGNHVLRPYVAKDGHPDIECHTDVRDFIENAPLDVQWLLNQLVQTHKALEQTTCHECGAKYMCNPEDGCAEPHHISVHQLLEELDSAQEASVQVK